MDTTGSDRRRREAFVRAATAAGWLLLLAAGVLALTTVGDSARSVLVYLAVWVASTTLPGVLLWRACARPTTIVQELGFGSVLGIALLLLAWLPATMVHRPALMWLWPAGIAVVFAAVPSLRRHWWPRRAPADRTPARWHAAMMLVCAVAFVRLYVLLLRLWTLPPKASSQIFQDAWYELSLTHLLRSSVAISDPAAAGVPLRYHWFSNAHVTATVELSGLPAAQVILHLWLVAMLLVLLLASAAATERLLQGPGGGAVRWWAGPVAALLAGGLPATMFLGEPRLPAINNGFAFSSTSGILALVVILALVGPVLDVLNGRAGRGTWLLLCLLLALGAGTKPSLLPVIACGGLLALLAQWVRTRRFPRAAAILTALPVLLFPLAALAVVGSTGGSRPQLLQTLALDRAFGDAAGVTRAAVNLGGHGGWLAPGLVGASSHVWMVSVALFALFVLTELPRLIGLLGPIHPALRHDAGIWWCAGVVAAGWGGLWVLSHPGYSQHYFWRIVIPLGIVLSVATAVRLLPEPPQRSFPAIAVVVAAGIAVAAAFVTTDPLSLPPDAVPQFDYRLSGRLTPYVITIAVGAVVILALRLVPWRWARVSSVALIVCFVLAVGTASAAYDLEKSVAFARAEPVVVNPQSARYVSGADQRAARWLQAHSDADDVVATNIFCVPTRYRVGCRHVAFWVAALTGRQLFVGAWAYTEQNLIDYGRGGNVPYQQLDSPWPDRVALSLAVIRAPTPATVSELERRGVDWIFANRKATVVSPRLAEFATLKYSNADVMIYRLDRRKGQS